MLTNEYRLIPYEEFMQDIKSYLTTPCTIKDLIAIFCGYGLLPSDKLLNISKEEYITHLQEYVSEHYNKTINHER